MAFACVASLIPYQPALLAFFASDDWLLLDRYGPPPFPSLGVHFGREVIWFYRPLQSLQFNLHYHLFGLEALPWNLVAYGMHLAVLWLAWRFLRELFGGEVFPAAATALFALHWVYVDVLFWKCNLNTLESGILTLACGWAMARQLRSPRPAGWALVYGLFCLNLLSRESAVNTPALLLLTWWQVRGRSLYGAGARTAEAARIFVPQLALVGAYVALHRLLVVDVAQDPTDYRFATAGQIPMQLGSAVLHLLLPFYMEPWVLPKLPSLQQGLVLLVRGMPYAALVPAIAAWRLRDRRLRFGLLWMVLSLVPTLLLTNYHNSRYYYLASLGAAVFGWQVFHQAWRRAGRFRPRRLLRSGLALLATYLALAGPATVHAIVSVDREDSDVAEAGYRFLSRLRGQFPPGSLIVLRNAPPGYFKHGLGATEMVRLALADPTSYGVVENARVPDARLQRINQIRTVFLLDLTERPLRLVRIPPPGG